MKIKLSEARRQIEINQIKAHGVGGDGEVLEPSRIWKNVYRKRNKCRQLRKIMSRSKTSLLNCRE